MNHKQPPFEELELEVSLVPLVMEEEGVVLVMVEEVNFVSQVMFFPQQ